MRISWGMATPVVSVALVCTAAIVWYTHKSKVTDQELTQDARQTRIIAERGDANAEVKLGNMYHDGRGLSQDSAQAMVWYRRAADQGNAAAQYEIGDMYDLGQGSSQDYTQALLWYRKAAGQGDSKAQCGIASMYYDGRGVPRNFDEAARWYQMAANGGLAKALFDLGYMYEHGEGVPQDLAKANQFYREAADRGDKYAQRVLGLRGTGLTALSAISLSAMLVGCFWSMKGSPSSQRNRNQRALWLAGLFGITYIGMSLYGSFGIFQFPAAVNGFYFLKNVAVGITIALLISVFRRDTPEVVLGISGLFLAAFTLLVFMRGEFKDIAIKKCAFTSVEGLLFGVVVSLAVLTWLKRRSPSSRISEMR
jgi:hypothetical protein